MYRSKTHVDFALRVHRNTITGHVPDRILLLSVGTKRSAGLPIFYLHRPFGRERERTREREKQRRRKRRRRRWKKKKRRNHPTISLLVYKSVVVVKVGDNNDNGGDGGVYSSLFKET